MTNDINTIQLIDKYGEKVTSAIGTIAEKIGVGTDHFWPILVRQQQIEGYFFYVSIFLIILISCIFFFITINKKLWNDESQNPSCFGIIRIVSLSVLLIAFIIICGSPIFFSKIVNPEFHALKEIATLIK